MTAELLYVWLALKHDPAELAGENMPPVRLN
jgi:hypothetical protein